MADFEVKFASEEINAKVQFGEVQTIRTGGEPYKGDYAVTPKVEKQVMPTKGKYMVDDVVVNPIPQEYGLITYDHNRTITVS